MFYILRAHNLPLQMQIRSPFSNYHDDLDLIMILILWEGYHFYLSLSKNPTMKSILRGILLAKDFSHSMHSFAIPHMSFSECKLSIYMWKWTIGEGGKNEMSPRILSDARLNNRRKSCRLCVVVIYAFLAMQRKLALKFLCFGSKLKKVTNVHCTIVLWKFVILTTYLNNEPESLFLGTSSEQRLTWGLVRFHTKCFAQLKNVRSIMQSMPLW